MVAPQLPPATGGVETHVDELTAALVRAGHELTLVGTVPPSHRPSEDPTDGDGVPGRTLVAVGRPHERHLEIPPAGFASAVAHAADGFDVAHLQSYHLPYAALARRALPPALPFLFTGHYHGTGHSRLSSAAHPVYRMLFGRRLFEDAARVVCVSQVEEARVRTAFPKARTKVIPNGIRPAPKTSRSSGQARGSRPMTILSVGRLERYKQHERVVEALALLPEARLAVVGDGPRRSRLERLASQVAPGRVDVLGRVSDSVLERLWEEADLFVSASLAESFGLSTARAVASGTPAVVSDIPAHREVAGAHGALLVDPHAPARAWADAFSRALAAPAPSGSFLSWDEVAAETAELYRAVLDADSSR